IHAARGDWPVEPSLPFIPGHEGVGIVKRMGPDVTEGRLGGDRVAIPGLGWACGSCEHCASGWETLCLRRATPGYSVDGGYADFALSSAPFVGPSRCRSTPSMPRP